MSPWWLLHRPSRNNRVRFEDAWLYHWCVVLGHDVHDCDEVPTYLVLDALHERVAA